MHAYQEPVIDQVQSGMKVVDSDGKELGTVEFVKLGDPAAATTEGQESDPRPGVVPILADVFTDPEPDLPPALAARLVRTGFVKVDAKGLFSRDLYVTPDQVARIDGNVVHLSAGRGALAKES
ncbi:hypothetical protein AB0K18_44910 [Nonomuraea sp. NPDC049421]|uniref:hypothetical protein n=1 Tax=unclassified Nonomuraea TaxID=2593643 RepID=UPI00339FAA04